jgi:hypothetical protein
MPMSEPKCWMNCQPGLRQLCRGGWAHIRTPTAIISSAFGDLLMMWRGRIVFERLFSVRYLALGHPPPQDVVRDLLFAR